MFQVSGNVIVKKVSVCDYRVVRFHEFHNGILNHHHYKFEIFRLSTSQWSEVDYVVQSGKLSRIHSDNLFFNGHKSTVPF